MFIKEEAKIKPDQFSVGGFQLAVGNSQLAAVFSWQFTVGKTQFAMKQLKNESNEIMNNHN